MAANDVSEPAPSRGFDCAILGVLCRPSQPAVLVYDAERMIDVVCESGVDRDEAEEYLEYNTFGACVDRAQPLFVTLRGPYWSIRDLNE